jgi:DNA-binding IclR family transcriptional regulator
MVHNVNFMKASSSARSGTQSIERAALLLRELALRGNAGWNLRDLALHCELDRATVHRMLKCLITERLVLQRADRRYMLGPMVFELGASLPHQGELCEAMRGTVRRLARRMPGVVALGFLRSGDDCVCVARSGAASYTSEATAIRVGHRAPLLTVASGVAILAAMPAPEMHATLTRNRRKLGHLGAAHVAQLDALAHTSARNGYVLSTGVVWRGIHSAAVAFGAGGDSMGSLVISGAAAEYPSDRLRRLLPELREAAESLGREAVSP